MSNLEIFTCSDESSSMVFIPKLYPMVMVYSGSEKYLFALNYTLCVRHRLYLVCIGCGATKPRTFHRIILWDIQFLAQGGHNEAAAFVTPFAKDCNFCTFV